MRKWVKLIIVLFFRERFDKKQLLFHLYIPTEEDPFSQLTVLINTGISPLLDIEGTIELGRYRVTEHKTSVTAIQGTIEVAVNTNFYYGSLTRYRDTEYRVRES